MKTLPRRRSVRFEYYFPIDVIVDNCFRRFIITLRVYYTLSPFEIRVRQEHTRVINPRKKTIAGKIIPDVFYSRLFPRQSRSKRIR